MEISKKNERLVTAWWLGTTTKHIALFWTELRNASLVGEAGPPFDFGTMLPHS